MAMKADHDPVRTEAKTRGEAAVTALTLAGMSSIGVVPASTFSMVGIRTICAPQDQAAALHVARRELRHIPFEMVFLAA